MQVTLLQRKQLITAAIYNLESAGQKIKEDAFQDALCSSIWAKNEAHFIELVSSSINSHKIPCGIKMPWGLTVTPSQTR